MTTSKELFKEDHKDCPYCGGKKTLRKTPLRVPFTRDRNGLIITEPNVWTGDNTIYTCTDCIYAESNRHRPVVSRIQDNESNTDFEDIMAELDISHQVSNIMKELGSLNN